MQLQHNCSMDARDILTHWDYDRAVAALEQHGDYALLARMARATRNSLLTDKVKAALEEIAEAMPPVAAAPAPAITGKPQKRRETRAAQLADAPSVVKDWVAERINIYRNVLAPLHEQLSNAGSDKDREAIVWKMMKVWERYDLLQGWVLRYEEKGVLPEKQEVSAEHYSNADLINRRNNLRTYISKYKNHPEKKEQYSREMRVVEDEINRRNL